MTTPKTSHLDRTRSQTNNPNFEQSPLQNLGQGVDGADLPLPAQDLIPDLVDEATVARNLDQNLAAVQQPEQSVHVATNLKSSRGKRAFDIANQMAEATSIGHLYQTAITEIRQRFQVDRALVYRFHSEAQGSVIAEVASEGYTPMLGQSLPAIIFGKPTAESYKQQASVAIANTTHSTATPHQMQLFNQFQIKASLSLPIFLENKLWGLLVVQQCSSTKQWNQNETNFLYLVATELQVHLQPLYFQAERQLLSALSTKVSQGADIEAVYRTATQKLRQLLTADRVAVCQFQPDYALRFVAEARGTAFSSMLNTVTKDSYLTDTKGGCFRQHNASVVHDIEQDPKLSDCYVEFLEAFNIRAYALTPIYQGEKLWGVLAAYQHSGAKQWESDDLSLLTQTSNLIGVALHQSQLISEKAIAVQNQEALPDIINKISSSDYAESIYQTAVQSVRELLKVERVCIYKFRRDYFGDFIYESESGGWPSLVGSAWEDSYVQKNQGGRFRNADQAYIADDIYTAGLSECHIQTLEHFGVKSFLIVAIRQGGKLWGLLSAFQHSGPRHWLESDTQILKDVSRQMEASLKGADYVAQLKAQSAQMTKAAQIGRSVAEIVPNILQTKTIEQSFYVTNKAVRSLLKCDRVAIHRFNADWTDTTISPNDQALPAIWPKTDLQETEGGPYSERKSLVVNNIHAANHDPLEIEALEEFGICAYITVPVFKEGKLWGLLSAYQKQASRSWMEVEINALKQIGIQLGSAMQQADYLKQLAKTTEQEQLISKITDRLRKTTDLPQTLKVTVRDIRQLIQADRVGLYQFDPDTRYSVGEFVAEDVAAGVRSAMSMKIKDHCFAEEQADNYQKGRYWVVNDVAALDLPDCLVNLLAEMQVRASLVVPLLKGDILWGLFAVHQCQGPREWEKGDVQFAHRIGAQLNLALQQADYLDQVKEKTAKLTETAKREKASKERLQQQVIDLLNAVGPALEGNLTVRAQVTETEVGTVASVYNNTLQSLQKIVLQVQAAANQVSETSKVSETAAASVNQQAQQQVEALQAALACVQTMVASTEAVAHDAQQVEAATQQTNQIVQRGDTAMNLTVDSIMGIRSTVAETNQRVKKLSESSQKISKIVSLIGQFTTQTQLLSLNASIEATRAGEYGRGFAVVADEVRSLARQSAAAATEIEQFVQEIQTGTAEVSTAMETGIQQVAEGTELVTDARQNLTAIVEATSQISQLIADITQTTHEQANEFKVVTTAMTDATTVANQTAQNATDLSTAIQQVLNTTKDLQSSTGKFKAE